MYPPPPRSCPAQPLATVQTQPTPPSASRSYFSVFARKRLRPPCLPCRRSPPRSVARQPASHRHSGQGRSESSRLSSDFSAPSSPVVSCVLPLHFCSLPQRILAKLPRLLDRCFGIITACLLYGWKCRQERGRRRRRTPRY